jgi:hypothetical protein
LSLPIYASYAHHFIRGEAITSLTAARLGNEIDHFTGLSFTVSVAWALLYQCQDEARSEGLRLGPTKVQDALFVIVPVRKGDSYEKD